MPTKKTTKKVAKRSTTKSVQRNSELTADNLKRVLWSNLHDVKNKKIDAREANSICGNARTILSIVKTELQVAKISGRTFNGTFVGE